jgi:hypothetical protein
MRPIRVSLADDDGLFRADEFVAGELGVAEDLAHESWANGFAGMHRHHSSSSVRMLKKVMASLDADYREGTLSQGPHDLGPCRARQATHAATEIRWTPTNVMGSSSSPSTSRQSSTASCIRSISSSRERAWV